MTVVASALVCRELRLRQFRNFSELELAFPPEGAVLIGDNGAGKTNLLEAIYYLEIFRSFQGAPDDQLIRFGAEAFHVRGRFGGAADAAQREVTAACESRGHRKRVTIDGVEPGRIGDAIGRVGAVVFSPSDMALVAGPPGERRRFLDIVLSLNAPGYLHALQRYRQVVRQRNAMLRAGAGAAALPAWDAGLAEWGARITIERAQWVAAHAEAFGHRYAAIGGAGPAVLRYRPSVPLDGSGGPDPGAVGARFEAELIRVRERERERGTTLVGPHRDELAIVVDGPDGEIELRDYGSGGQLRTAAVALRMVEAETVRDVRGQPPLILLDDVFAELDPGRSERILALLDAQDRGQVILTAPKASDVGMRKGDRNIGFTSSLAAWRIEGGRVYT